MLQDIFKEHCDGNRNILHTCVAMCSPTSNKDYDQGKQHSDPPLFPTGKPLPTYEKHSASPYLKEALNPS